MTGAVAADRARVQILLVEDSAVDIRLTREALRDAKVLNDLHVAHDGVEALDYLHRRVGFDLAVRPDLILLDLSLPRKDGRQVLAEIKTDDGLRAIPVAVLTQSAAVADVQESYQLGANCYLTKPVDVTHFLRAVQAIEGFWLGVVRLPPHA